MGCLASMLSGFAAWILFLKTYPDLPADLMAVPVGALALVIGTVVSRTPPIVLTDASGIPLDLTNRIGIRFRPGGP